MYAEKCPNARGVRRVLEATAGAGDGEKQVLSYEQLLARLGKGDIAGVVLTGNYPDAWGTSELSKALTGKFVVLIDTLESSLMDSAAVVLPGATWAEKAGTFENARNMLQAFEQAIPVTELAKSEAQLALDLLAALEGVPAPLEQVESVVVQTTPGQVAAGAMQTLARSVTFNAANVRQEMAGALPALLCMVKDVKVPVVAAAQEADMEMVEL